MVEGAIEVVGLVPGGQPLIQVQPEPIQASGSKPDQGQ